MPVAVVTGSSSGIGRATAMELASHGFQVILHGNRNLAGLQETAAMIAASAGTEVDGKSQTLALTADISSARACRDLVTAAFGWQGRVDAWVNNAGADVLTGPIAEAAFERKLHHLIEVDLMGCIRLSRLAAESMSQQTPDRGTPSIINTSWDQATWGMEGNAGQLFCTTKAAIEAFTKSLALTVGPSIRVNCVAPGWIKTKWGENAPAYWSERARSESLLDRWGLAEDVARTVRWLVSRDAEFINAATIPINGGFRMAKARSNGEDEVVPNQR